METAKILVVEDDEDINFILRNYLEREDYQVTCAYSGTEAKLQLTINTFDLILLDLMLPGITGEELIQEIRQKAPTPIIVISAKSSLEDKVNALKNGADDYVTKPFEREEVLARVCAMIRRSQTFQTSKPKEKDYEFDILLLLLQHPDRVFTKEQLYQEIWKTGYYGEDNTINVHISNIRKKIKEYDDQSYIKTVWGIGFKIENTI